MIQRRKQDFSWIHENKETDSVNFVKPVPKSHPLWVTLKKLTRFFNERTTGKKKSLDLEITRASLPNMSLKNVNNAYFSFRSFNTPWNSPT